MGSFTLTRLQLEGYQFRLLYNGMAYDEWNSDYGGKNVTIDDPEGIAEFLYVLGRNASAFCLEWGYPADAVPELEDLKRYLKHTAMPWERVHAITCINNAIGYGSRRDFLPEGDDKVDVDTLELKKN